MTDATWKRLVVGYQTMPVKVATIDRNEPRRRALRFDVPDLSGSRLVDDDEETRPEFDASRVNGLQAAEAAE
jgi:hypothetical protein